MNIYTQAVSDQKRAANSKVVEMVLAFAKTGPKTQVRANGSGSAHYELSAIGFK
jgi:hypothetical protein